MKNLYDISPTPPSGTETFETLLTTPGTTITRIASNDVKDGKWYDQNEDEWVVLLQGSATLEFEPHRLLTLDAGEHCFIKAHQRHRVKATSADALWLAVHLTPKIS